MLTTILASCYLKKVIGRFIIINFLICEHLIYEVIVCVTWHEWKGKVTTTSWHCKGFAEPDVTMERKPKKVPKVILQPARTALKHPGPMPW